MRLVRGGPGFVTCALIVLATPAVASAAGRCEKPGARVVMADAHTRVVRVGTGAHLQACDVRRGRFYELDDPTSVWEQRGRIALAGGDVAGEFATGIGKYMDQFPARGIWILDARTGRRRTRALVATLPGGSPQLPPPFTDLVAIGDGRAAVITPVATDGHAVEIVGPGSRVSVLDSGPDVAGGSLALSSSPSILYWTAGGQPRNLPLGPLRSSS